MLHRRALRLTAALLLLAATGCTSLREIPRTDYTAQTERRDVRVSTRDGLEYEFDYAHFGGDSLVGYRSRDIEGAFEDFAVVRLPLEDVTTLAARGVDWRRTSLIGGGVLFAGVAIGVSGHKASTPTPTNSGGGTGPGGRVP